MPSVTRVSALQSAPVTSSGHRVIVGFDGSVLAHHAVDYVTGRAEPEDTVVIVYAYGSAPEASEYRRSIAQAILDTALSPTGRPGVPGICWSCARRRPRWR